MELRPSRTLALALTEGRVIEAMAWPAERTGEGWETQGMGPGSAGIWQLGKGQEGRVRARIEAPMEASLTVRGGDQAVSIPVAAILEGPQRTPASAPLTVAVERLAWDALSVDLGPSAADGIVAPGTDFPVSVGFNILWPESAEMAVRMSATLQSVRGGEVLVRVDQQVTQWTNRRQPDVRITTMRAPRSEGTYVLEIRASWEPLVRDGSRLSRLIRRRKPAATSSSVRRVMLTVLDPEAMDGRPAGREARKGEDEVDSVDFTRSRSYRPLASGRSPLAEPGHSAWEVPAEALIGALAPRPSPGLVSLRSGGEAAGAGTPPTARGWPGRPSG